MRLEQKLNRIRVDILFGVDVIHDPEATTKKWKVETPIYRVAYVKCSEPSLFS